MGYFLLTYLDMSRTLWLMCILLLWKSLYMGRVSENSHLENFRWKTPKRKNPIQENSRQEKHHAENCHQENSQRKGTPRKIPTRKIPTRKIAAYHFNPNQTHAKNLSCNLWQYLQNSSCMIVKEMNPKKSHRKLEISVYHLRLLLAMLLKQKKVVYL